MKFLIIELMTLYAKEEQPVLENACFVDFFNFLTALLSDLF